MERTFVGTIVEWRGPAPYLFVPVPDEEVDAVRDAATVASYGWGVVPCRARIGHTSYTTSIFPKDGGYLVPVKVAVQRAEHVGEGDEVELTIAIEV